MMMWVGIRLGGFAMNYEGNSEKATIQIDPVEGSLIRAFYEKADLLAFVDIPIRHFI